jgi:hypothetical protein
MREFGNDFREKFCGYLAGGRVGRVFFGNWESELGKSFGMTDVVDGRRRMLAGKMVALQGKDVHWRQE